MKRLKANINLATWVIFAAGLVCFFYGIYDQNIGLATFCAVLAFYTGIMREVVIKKNIEKIESVLKADDKRVEKILEYLGTLDELSNGDTKDDFLNFFIKKVELPLATLVNLVKHICDDYKNTKMKEFIYESYFKKIVTHKDVLSLVAEVKDFIFHETLGTADTIMQAGLLKVSIYGPQVVVKAVIESLEELSLPENAFSILGSSNWRDQMERAEEFVAWSPKAVLRISEFSDLLHEELKQKMVVKKKEEVEA